MTDAPPSDPSEPGFPDGSDGLTGQGAGEAAPTTAPRPERPGPPGPPLTAPWTVLDAVAAIVLWFLLAFVLGGTFVLLARGALEQIYIDAVALVLGSLSVSAAVLIWLNVRNPQWVRQVFGMRRPVARDIAIAVVAGGVMFVVLILGVGNVLQLIINARGGEAPPVQEGLQDLVRDPRTAPILLLSTVLLAPVGEELLFRGMLFPALRKHLGPWPAIGMSALLFSFIHFEPNPAGYLLVILILFPAGMVFGRLYEWRQTVWVPIVAHSVFNTIQVGLALALGEPV